MFAKYAIAEQDDFRTHLNKYNMELQDEYIDLLRGLFKGEQAQRFILLAYITGILPVKRYNSQSALNNFIEYTMTSPKRLAEYINMDYDGLKQSIVRILAGERCSVDIETFENDMTSFCCSDDVLTVLIHLGYLGYDSATREVYIPNEEVRRAFEFAFSKLHSYRKELLYVCIGRLIIVPLIFISIAVCLGYRDSNLVALMVMLASPTVVSSFSMASEMGGNGELAGMIMVFTSVLSIITIFLWVWVLNLFSLI